MATRDEKIAWAFEQYGPENVYMDGEISNTEAMKHAVDLYNRAHDIGYVPCPNCGGKGSKDGYACRTCWTHGKVKG